RRSATYDGLSVDLVSHQPTTYNRSFNDERVSDKLYRFSAGPARRAVLELALGRHPGVGDVDACVGTDGHTIIRSALRRQRRLRRHQRGLRVALERLDAVARLQHGSRIKFSETLE